MKRIFGPLAALALAFAFSGCSGGDSMDKNELDALKTPGKEVPKEAQEAMSKMGEMMEKQKEANKAAGVDDRGIPIGK